MTSVQMIGIDEVIKITDKLSKKETYDKFYNKIVNECADLMRNFAPVDTGRLEDSIKVMRKGMNEYEIIVGVPYAVFMEWGTRYFPVGTPESPRVRPSKSGKIAYHPFMRLAVYIIDDEFNYLIKRILFNI